MPWKPERLEPIAEEAMSALNMPEEEKDEMRRLGEYLRWRLQRRLGLTQKAMPHYMRAWLQRQLDA